jgi:hypothetical protein
MSGAFPGADDEPVSRKPRGFWKKLMTQPLIPLGCLGTAGVLIYGIYNFQIGNKEMSQKMMRWRVMSQFGTLTVIGVTMGGFDFYEVRVFRHVCLALATAQSFLFLSSWHWLTLPGKFTALHHVRRSKEGKGTRH